MTLYEEFLVKLDKAFAEFKVNAVKGETSKPAALIARKDSMKLREMLKEFRTISVQNDRGGLVDESESPDDTNMTADESSTPNTSPTDDDFAL